MLDDRPAAAGSRALALAGIAFCVFAASSVGAEERFRVGISGGLESWEEDVSTLGVAPATLDLGAEPAPSVVAQYIIRAVGEGERGFYVGMEASGGGRSAEQSQTVTVPAFGGVPIDFTVTGQVDWSADFMWFGGYDFGRWSAFVTGGASFVGGSGKVEFAGVTAEDEQVHVGWKFGPGVEFDLGNNMSLTGRVTLGQYRNRGYTAEGLPVAVDVEPMVADARVTWLYRFDAGQLLGGWR